ncbi:conserved Plasmodium protein, unknown function [Plasmodium gallinaceum]|uniref:Uncharacterized protein n=1 Tax=Plasmodium gallinaceum TaxID=5849 RepID=A0A1J1GS83_PLAGA|nr:conserved Plasmodium protein, unknown function [Plasmodium gallinaceum]CRG95355.1 conserved Plasmodium protein, unknown function [Plasmodium gallinaceum]
MFRSKAHFLMLANLKYLELQKLLLNRFQIFKNEEIRILKKENMKTILYEWAKFLTEKNQDTNITNIPPEVLKIKKVIEILKDDIDCKWLIDKINIENNNGNNINKVENDELKKIDNLHFDEYPQLFYYEYPQYPYNYYDKKKMTSLYSLIKFPYNDILNISKRVNVDNLKKGNEIQEKEEKEEKKEKKEKEENKINESITKKLNENENFINYSNNNYVYAPSEMETSKENYH